MMPLGGRTTIITLSADQEKTAQDVESECSTKTHGHKSTENDSNNNVLIINIASKIAQVGINNSVVFSGDKNRQEKTVVGTGNDNASAVFLIDSLASQQQKGNEFSEENTEESDSERRTQITTKEKKKRKKQLKSKAHPKNLELVVHKSPACAEPSQSYLELYKMSDDVMMQVKILRDSGRWDLFEDRAVSLSHKYTTLDAQIVLLLERGLAACYNNNLQDAKKLIKSGIEMAHGTENSSALVGRGHYYLSALYRRKNKFGKAISCVEIADQTACFGSTVTADTCSLSYERGCALMDFALQCQHPRPGLLKRVMANLRRSIDECLVLYEEDSFQGHSKTHHYALMKMAMLLLDCRTPIGRKRSVGHENVQEAEKYLSILKERYWEKTSRGEKVQYFFAQADLHYRKKQYQRARELALEALDMAESHGFNTEIRLAQGRLEDIDKQQRACSQSSDKDAEPPDNNDGDVSSSSDSDWLSKPSLS